MQRYSKLSRIMLICFILLVASSAKAAYNCTTLTGDDSTDNSSALTACLASAESEVDKICNISAGASYYQLASKVEIPQGVSLVGANGASIRGKLAMNADGGKIINIDFAPGDRVVNIGENGYVTGAHVRDSSFLSASLSNIWIKRGHETIIDNNTFTNGASGQNIIVTGGKRNVIVNNTIVGGITGIILLHSRNVNGGGNESIFEDHIIMDNDVSNVDEEFISIDMGANSSIGTPVLDTDTVSSVSGADVTLTHANWGATGGVDPNFVGYYMIVATATDTSIIGSYEKITAQSDAVFTVENAITGLANGDVIVIGAPALRTMIAFNYTHGGGYQDAGILLYGLNFHARVEYNTSNGTNSVHYNRFRVSDLDVTGQGNMAPNGFNIFRGNTVGDGACTYPNDCDIEFYLHNIGVAGSWPHYKAYGQVAVDNSMEDRLYMGYQDYYTSGNTVSGDTDIVASTDAGSTALDVTDQTCVEYGLYCVAAGSTIALVDDLDSTCAGATICSGYSLPPTLSTAVIASNGTTLTLSFDTAVYDGSAYADAHWDIDASTGGDDISLTYVEGKDTSTWVFTSATTILSGETVNIDFDGTANSVENSAGNDLAAIVSTSVTNNSTQSAAAGALTITTGSGNETVTAGSGNQTITVE